MRGRMALLGLGVVAILHRSAEVLPAQTPARPRAVTVRTADERRWLTRSAPAAEVHVLRGSRAEALIATLPDAVDRAIAANLRFLGGEFTGPKLQLFIVGSDAEMTSLIGGQAFGSARPEQGTAYLIANDSMHPALRHELMHLLVHRKWGRSRSPWLEEGLATNAAGSCAGYSISAIAAELNREVKLVPLATLWRNFSVAWEAGAINYVEAGSLVDIDRSYGRDRLRALWQHWEDGKIEAILGIDRETLEQQWKSDLARHAPSPPWATIFPVVVSRGCE